MQCILAQISDQWASQKADHRDLNLVLKLVVVVAELLAHVSRHKAALGRLALGLLDNGHDGR
jgi:hypothetical protein